MPIEEQINVSERFLEVDISDAFTKPYSSLSKTERSKKVYVRAVKGSRYVYRGNIDNR